MYVICLLFYAIGGFICYDFYSFLLLLYFRRSIVLSVIFQFCVQNYCFFLIYANLFAKIALMNANFMKFVSRKTCEKIYANNASARDSKAGI